MGLVRRVYWDSCVVISFIEGTPSRIKALTKVMEAAQAGEVQLITSTYTVSEVAATNVERTQKRLDPDTEQQIDALWLPGGIISLVEYHFLTGQEARTLIRGTVIDDTVRNLKGKDAAHLATARLARADEFHTYDKELLVLGPLVGFPVCEPQHLTEDERRGIVPLFDTSSG